MAVFMLDDFDEMLPVTCDENPLNLVSWYNKKTKKIVSNEVYYSIPDKIGDHVPINKQNVEKFYSKAKESLQQFGRIITETIDSIT